jgi:uncharacterized protein YecE (DUF72 family)
MCKGKLPQYRIAMELRNSVWLSEKNQAMTLDFLRRNDLPFVCVDEPQGFKSSVPPVAEVTSDIGLIRFHGRNKETWEKKGISPAERFNYLYTEEELKPWASKIEELAKQIKELHVLFNNCHQDKSVACFTLRLLRKRLKNKVVPDGYNCVTIYIVILNPVTQVVG